jgi:hypothetical protein
MNVNLFARTSIAVGHEKVRAAWSVLPSAKQKREGVSAHLVGLHLIVRLDKTEVVIKMWHDMVL